MRVAMFVVSILVVATPSEASKSCMSETEARQHFGAVHIYWHGTEHCWDASPTSHHHQIQTRQKTPIREVERSRDQPNWHDAMSEMLADDEPVPSLRTPSSSDAGYREKKHDDSLNGTPWADRWVAIEPSQSPLVARRVRLVQVTPTPVTEYKAAPVVSAHDIVVLAFIAFILTLGTIEAMYRSEL